MSNSLISVVTWRKLALRLSAALIGFVGIATVLTWIAPEEAVHLAYKFGRHWASLERKDAYLPDGTHFAYLDGGAGEPLILLHGFGGNKDYFLAFAHYLTPHFRVLIPDVIGFGESSHLPGADYSPLAQAERLHALLSMLGIARTHVGGTSTGAQIALTYASRYPDQTGSVLAIGAPGVSSAKLSPYQEERKRGHNALLVSNTDDMAHLLALLTEKPPWIPSPLLAGIGAERIRDRQFQEEMVKQRRSDPLEERVAGIATPTLLIWGSADKIVDPDAGRILHSVLPNSRLLLKANIGHSVAIECPKALADDYLDFRASLSTQAH